MLLIYVYITLHILTRILQKKRTSNGKISMVCWPIIVTNEQLLCQQFWLDRMYPKGSLSIC